MVPAAIRSRFFAVLGLMAQLAVPLGTGIYGVLLDRFPPHLFLLAVSLLNSAITWAFLLTASPEAFAPGAAGEGEDARMTEVQATAGGQA